MPLPTAAPERQLTHRRSIDVQIYARGNGLWEVDARIQDVRSHPVKMVDGMRPAGEPIHHMLLRLVVDERLNILEAGAETYSMPYPGQCDAYGDAYGRLVGLNLMRNFRHGVRDRLGGVKGCTHLDELSLVLPTAVIQAFAGNVIDSRGEAPGSEQPFQLDRCQALRLDGPTVREHYPRWYRAPRQDSVGNAPAAPDVPHGPDAPDAPDGLAAPHATHGPYSPDASDAPADAASLVPASAGARPLFANQKA